MKWLLCLVVATILLTFAAGERPSVTLEPMKWSTHSYFNAPFYQVITSKDLLVYFDYTNTAAGKRGIEQTSNPVTVIRRRNSEGVYLPVATVDDYAILGTTNGKWVALISGEKIVSLFTVDGFNAISRTSNISSNGGYLLSDDTFVGQDPVPNNDGSATIRSYQYNISTNRWNTIPGSEVTFAGATYLGDFAMYRATDTHLVFVDLLNNTAQVKIYSRQTDKSWMFIDSVPVNGTAAELSSVVYNGVDTLIFASLADFGTVFVYTKIDGKWTAQLFTVASVGYRPQGGLGVSTAFLDANTLLMTASLEGFDFNSNSLNNIGKVLMMTRNEQGLWEPSLDLSNPVSAGVWGLSVGINDYDVIIPNFIVANNVEELRFYTAPRCFYQPIDVTCNDQQVNDCSLLNVSSLYTINNAQCGGVTASITGVSLVDNKALKAQFSFSKNFDYGAPVYCNATVTCPAPPLPPVTIQQTPSKVSSAVVLVQSGLVSTLLGFTLMFA